MTTGMSKVPPAKPGAAAVCDSRTPSLINRRATRRILARTHPVIVVAVFAPAFAVAAVAVCPIGQVAVAIEAVERVFGRAASAHAP